MGMRIVLGIGVAGNRCLGRRRAIVYHSRLLVEVSFVISGIIMGWISVLMATAAQ